MRTFPISLIKISIKLYTSLPLMPVFAVKYYLEQYLVTDVSFRFLGHHEFTSKTIRSWLLQPKRTKMESNIEYY